MSNVIPKGWTLQPLSALANYYNGRAFKPEDWSTEGLPIIRIAQINNKDADMDYYAGDDISIKNLVKDGDLLFSWSATLTALIWNRGNAVLNQHIFKVEEKEGIDRQYLHQVILNSIEPLADYSHGSTMKHIKKGVLDEYCVVTPPLPEQQKIATILTSVDTVIEKTRAQIDKLKDLKTGMMQELLTKGIGHTEFKNTPVGRIPETWKVKTLGDLIKSMDGGVSVNGENREKGLNEIGVLKVSSVFKGQFLPQEHKAVVPEDVSRVRLNPKKDHILFSRANTPLLVGESAYIDKDYHDLFLPDKLWMIDVKDRRQVNVKWLSYILCSEQVRSAITDAATGSSSTMKNISKPSLLGISTVLPPIFEQKKISDMLQSVDEKTIVTIQKLKNLTKIKKALMQDLLTGKVRVQSLKKL